jgi:hypothetical protein
MRDESTPHQTRPGALRATAAAALLLASLAACGEAGPHGRDSGAQWRGTMDTLPNGAISVANPADGVWPAGGGWRLVEELRIGRVDGTGPDVFGGIDAVGVSPVGEIHVIDGQAQEVRVFDERGAHLRTLGRRGGGPGEFNGAYGLSWDGDGNLWVTDSRNARYVVFDPAGQLVGHLRREVPGALFPWLGGRGEDGMLYDPAARAGEGVGAAVFTHYVVDAGGAVVDSLPPVMRPATGLPPMLSMTLLRLSPRLILAFDRRGYIWSAMTDDYRLIQRTFTGDTARIVTRAFRRAPVTDADRDTIRLELADPQYAHMPTEMRNPPIPTHRVAIERIYVADDGHVFVQPIGDGSAPAPLDVFDPDGRYLGPLAATFHLVPMPALPVFRDGRVWGVTEDTLGVRYVIRARLERAS